MHLSQLHTLAVRGEFSMKFVTEMGEIVFTPRCICTSFYSKGRTMNIKFCDSGEVRTVVRLSIIEFNGKPIYL